METLRIAEAAGSSAAENVDVNPSSTTTALRGTASEICIISQRGSIGCVSARVGHLGRQPSRA